MGSFRGHFFYGIIFFLMGVWQLINHIILHLRNPTSFTIHTWFPTSKFRYSELLFIIFGSTTAIVMELFLGLLHYQPLDPDGSIPATHLHNFEHSIIALGILIYGVSAIVLDKLAPPEHQGLTNILGGVAFGLEVLMFHVHSTDHVGVEGQYHWLLQLVILTSCVTTLLSNVYGDSFLIAFVRSLSIVFQGAWFVNFAFMLWTPGLIPKGCYMNWEKGYFIVRCHGEKALERAKSLANIQFSYYIVGLSCCAVALYLVMFRLYGNGNGGMGYEYEMVARLDADMEEATSLGLKKIRKEAEDATGNKM